MPDSFELLAQRLQAFAKAREWEQFHSPKNLASALIVEAGELLEHFQWLSEEQSHNLSPEKREQVASEMADVLLYLIQLSSALGVNLPETARRKIELNEKRYPVDAARGSAKKHDEL